MAVLVTSTFHGFNASYIYHNIIEYQDTWMRIWHIITIISSDITQALVTSTLM